VTATLEAANDALRQAVETRLAGRPTDDPKVAGYSPLAGCQPAQECAAKVLADAWQGESCCEGRKFYGHSLLKDETHPTSQAFFDLCDSLKEMHRRKSSDYGCPSGTDPLANIRNGAKFVGIPDWKGAMVRLSDKVTRLASYNATGRLENESLDDTLLDLASYSLLALLLHREERGE
jgi:hypothetical protein